MSLSQFNLNGRVALVTGASSRGIGNGSAKILAEAGAKVFLVARREDKLQDAVQEIEKLGMTHPKGMDDLFEKYVAPAAAKIPLGRLGTIDDIANGVLYLASDASEWVTGHSLIIDGGELA